MPALLPGEIVDIICSEVISTSLSFFSFLFFLARPGSGHGENVR